MELIIGIIVVVAIIYFFGKMFAWTVYCGYWYLVLAYIVAMVVIELIISHQLNKKNNGSMLKSEEKAYDRLRRIENEEYKEQMVEYNRKVCAYNDAMKQYEEDCKAVLRENKQQFESELPALEQTLRNAEANLEEAQQSFDSDDTLDWRDKNLTTINFLIERISRKRANSISEALNQLDAKNEAEAREKARAKQEKKIKEEEEKKRIRDAELERIRLDYEWRKQRQREMQEYGERMEAQRKLNSIDQSLRELSGRDSD